MKADGLQQRMLFLAEISTELAPGLFRLTPPRLFVLAVICEESNGTKDAIQEAARHLPPELESVGLHRLRHRSRANQVLRDLWRNGLLCRMETSDTRSPTYYPSPHVQHCLLAARRRARGHEPEHDRGFGFDEATP